jgi:hypothetical protein
MEQWAAGHTSILALQAFEYTFFSTREICGSNATGCIKAMPVEPGLYDTGGSPCKFQPE